MGGFPLPQPPQLPSPQMGQRGGGPAVVQSASWNDPAAIAQGISNFAQNYMLMSRQQQEQAKQRVYDTIQLANLGVPIDDKQLVKDIKKSKLPIALDPDSAGTFAAPQAAGSGPQSSTAPPPGSVTPQAIQRMMMAQPQMPAGMPPASVPTPMPPGAQGPASQTPIPSPGSVPPDVAAAAQTPGAQTLPQVQMPVTLRSFLSGLTQKGYKESQLRGVMQNITQGALQGDPAALEMATRLGVTKSLGAHDELFLLANKLFPDLSPEEAQGKVGQMLLYDAMGGPQRQAKMMELAKDMAPYFGNSLQRAQDYVSAIYSGRAPSEQPQMSFEQFDKLHTMSDNLSKQYPTSGQLPALVAAQVAAGHTNDAMKTLQGIAAHYPTQGQYEMDIKNRQLTFDAKKWDEQKQIDWARYNQATTQFNQTYAMDQLRFLQSKAGAQFEDFWKIYNDKDSSLEAKNEAVLGLADAMQKQGVDVTTENIKRLMKPIQGENIIQTRKNTGAAGFAGKPPKNPFTGKEDAGYANGLWDYLKRFGGNVVDYYLGTNLGGPLNEEDQ